MEQQTVDRNQTVQISDLARLNEEYKQVREILKRKKAEREQAEREGRKLTDLSPEIERLGTFLADAERASSKLKAASLASPRSLDKINALSVVLDKARAQIENEKRKLEDERTAREQGQLTQRLQELQRLREDRAGGKRQWTSELENHTLSKEDWQAEDHRSLQTMYADDIKAIRLELQERRERIQRDQDSLKVKQQDLEQNRRQIEEESRILEAKTADVSVTPSELNRTRKAVLSRQEQLDFKQKEFDEMKFRVDEQKRQLRERINNIERMLTYDT